MSLPGILIGTAVALVLYTYLFYPLLLRLWGSFRPRRTVDEELAEWPLISITAPAYNEEAQIRGLLESLLALDYPAERRQILIISDASTDRTDEIVAEYADRGVELLRMPQRSGKTAAENAARARLRGEIIVNTDASIRIDPGALKPLVARFADPTVGVASGRDVSMARVGGDPNAGESGYVGYEMTVRALEDRIYGIIGASGCFYGIRAALHGIPLPESLSRDFGAALNARDEGFRAVSVAEAICYVPRAGSLKREYRRKVRTMIRGMQTLHYKRHLLNPLRYGVFAWMLFSHKVCRWLVPWALVGAAAGIVALAPTQLWACWATGAILAGLAAAAIGWWWPEGHKAPKGFAVPAYLAVGNIAALHASLKSLAGAQNPVWEPTRRDTVQVVAHGEG
jgi:cellulose synthase/poly-beta-1,6-N-acetylglucosamine synthase-like glycosyltransferase